MLDNVAINRAKLLEIATLTMENVAPYQLTKMTEHEIRFIWSTKIIGLRLAIDLFGVK